MDNGQTAVCGDLGGQNLETNPLMQAVVATRTLQTLPDVSASNVNDPLYKATATQAHLVAPIVFQERLLAIVSLHWSHSYRTLADVSDILKIAINQMAQALIAIRCR